MKRGVKKLIKSLNKIRKIDTSVTIPEKITNSILVIVLGAIVGVFLELIYNFNADDVIEFVRTIILNLKTFSTIIAILALIALDISLCSSSPLRSAINALLFCLGTCLGYYIYSRAWSGIVPDELVKMLKIATIASPFVGLVAWYSKGTGIVSIIVSSIIIAAMALLCFNIGFWYFSLINIISLLVFIATIFVLYNNPKDTIISFIAGIILAYLAKLVI